MAQQTTERTELRQDQVAAASPVVVPELVPVKEIVKQIRRDSRAGSAEYLNETAVPFGGE